MKCEHNSLPSQHFLNKTLLYHSKLGSYSISRLLQDRNTFEDTVSVKGLLILRGVVESELEILTLGSILTTPTR